MRAETRQRRLCLGYMLALGMLVPARAALLGTYQFTGSESEVPAPVVGLTFGPFARYCVTASPSAGVYKSIAWDDTGIHDLAEYVEFVITPASGYQASLTSIVFDWAKIGPKNGPREGEIRVYRSVNTPAADATPASVSGAFSYASSFPASGSYTHNLSGFTTAEGEKVYMRLYGWDGSSSSGDLAFDNVAINGTVTLASVPVSVVQFASPTSSGLETVSPAVLNVVLSPAATQAVTVAYAVTGGTATGGGVDYTLVPGSLVFNAGETSKTISIPIINDGLDEADETIVVTLTGLVGGRPTLGVMQAAGAVTLSWPAADAGYALQYRTDVAAPPGWVAVTNAVTVSNGMNQVTVPLAAQPGFFRLAGSGGGGGGGAQLGSQTNHTYTILDPRPSVQFAAGRSSGSEAVSPASILVNLSAASAQVVTADYAVTGGTATGGGVDYTLASGTLTFNPGETGKTISLVVLNDGVAEPDETVVITLSNGVHAKLGSIAQHTYTILDTSPRILFAAAASSGSEAVSSASIPVILSAAAGGTVTVNYAVTGGTATGGGVDYTLANGTLSFNPGVLTQYVNITILDDTNQEPAETIVFTLSNVVGNAMLGSISSHTFMINDDDTTEIPFADSDTVVLWLFDETDYSHTVMLDASTNEYDLELMDGGHLVAGKFGHALSVSPGSGYSVEFAAIPGKAIDNCLTGPNGSPSGLWGQDVAPAQILNLLSAGSLDWAVEFWLKLNGGAPGSEVAVLDMGQAYNTGVAIHLSAGAASFNVANAYAGYQAVCPTTAGTVADGQWHHVAFTRTGSNGQMKHYLDGQLQAAPTVTPISTISVPASTFPSDLEHDCMGFSVSMSDDQRRQNRFNLSLGQDLQSNLGLNGLIDEVRISKGLRYTGNFSLPGTLSRNYVAGAAGPVVSNGPALLFAGNPSVLQLGGRKHVFLDTQLFQTVTSAGLVMNPPSNPVQLPVTVALHAQQPSVFEVNGRIYMFICDAYSSAEGISQVWYSDDGINFTIPNWGIINYNGTANNPYVLYHEPMYGVAFRDLNPAVPANEVYKLTSWVADRGICLYLSPDGVHWRRNETIMLPLVSGGAQETYFDDQRGRYYSIIKRDSSFNTSSCPGSGRRGTGFFTTEANKTYPFTPMSPPYYEHYPMPCPTCEGPVVFPVTAAGQVYRTRAQKYPYAPDAYLAFIWRAPEGAGVNVDLAVSRDGDNWTAFATSASGPWYLAPINGNAEALSMYGMASIRRGDELWQYVEFGTGVQSGGTRTYWRMTQRLDGFTSLDAGGTTGVLVSKPLVFGGNKLVLNLNASGGSARVALLDGAGNAIPGYGIPDCNPITANVTAQTVTWNGSSAVGSLAGTLVKLRFEMTNTKLYALQFVP